MVSCQFALYSLGVEDLSPSIDAAVAELEGLGLIPEMGPMSTYMTGEPDMVFEGLQRAYEAAARSGHVVMTITVSNGCPLPPDREAS